MRSKGNAPTSAQKRWREAVRGLGSIISGQPALIHHMFGQSCSLKSVGNIGHFSLLPLTDEEHKFRHSDKKLFEALYGTEKELFAKVCERVEAPFSEEIYNEIMRYHK